MPLTIVLLVFSAVWVLVGFTPLLFSGVGLFVTVAFASLAMVTGTYAISRIRGRRISTWFTIVLVSLNIAAIVTVGYSAILLWYYARGAAILGK